MSWPVVRLKDIAELINGDRSKNYPSGSDIVDSGVLFLNSKNIVNNKLDLRFKNFITQEKFASLSRGKLERNDLVITLRGTLGSCCIFSSKYTTGFINAQMMIIRPTNKVDASYLYYFITSPGTKNRFERLNTGSAVPQLTGKQIGELEIPLPPLDEQKRIAAILDRADAIRQKRKQAIELADEFLRSVFLEMFGDPVTNPKGWEQVPLSTLSDKILNGTTPKGGSDVYVEKGIAFLRSQNVWKKRIDLDDIVYLDDETHAKMSKSSLKHKDILITKTGRINTENSSLGRAAIYYGKDDEANINGHVYLVRLKPDNVHEFIEFILTTKEYRDHIRSVCVGGVDKRQLNKNHIEEFPIICPPSNEQQRFVKILHQSQKVLDNYKEQLVEAQNNFSALTQKAFLGQL